VATKIVTPKIVGLPTVGHLVAVEATTTLNLVAVDATITLNLVAVDAMTTLNMVALDETIIQRTKAMVPMEP
jgi:hypothetical protein